MKQTSKNPVTDRVQQAIHWHLLRNSGEYLDTDKNDFDAWYAIKENALAYQRLEAIWGKFEVVDDPIAINALHDSLTIAATDKSGNLKKSTFCILSLLVFGLSLTYFTVTQQGFYNNFIASGHLFADHNTNLGEQDTIILADGSQVYLNTLSSINLKFDEKQRVINLLNGEIMVDVAEDITRPLIVKTQHGTVRALGTQFIVRDYADKSSVSVTESQVEVCTHDASSEKANCLAVETGQKTDIHKDWLKKPTAIDQNFKINWQRQQLIVNDQPLLTVLNELNRHKFFLIQANENELLEMKISGVFPLDDIQRSLFLLENNLPIRIKNYASLVTVVALEQ